MKHEKTPKDQPQEDGPESSQDPNYKAAFRMAMTALYGQNAAEDVAQAIKSSNNPAQAIANTAYDMVSIVDERTQQSVPDELLIPLASDILGEVVEIGTAAGLKISGQMIAEATRMMLLRYVSEQGIDTSQLQKAMGQVDTAQLGAALEEMGGR